MVHTKHNPLQQATYLTSAATKHQLPPDQGVEVAFAGRSNAGKSSALNVITGIKGLARTSKTPGCTQLLNFFQIDAEQRLVDLPGYGYAKVPEAIKLRWQKTLEHFFATRQSLRGLILVSDIRHALTKFDLQMITWTHQYQLPIHILLTKSDKISRQAATKTLFQVRAVLKQEQSPASVQLFSALNGTGAEEARNKVLQLMS